MEGDRVIVEDKKRSERWDDGECGEEGKNGGGGCVDGWLSKWGRSREDERVRVTREPEPS